MLRQIAVAASLLVSASAAWAGEAAHVVFVVGQVLAAEHELKLGAAVNEGDEISTGADTTRE